ncbi:MAG: UPF0164 family protein [Candidatus Bipolaricaulota bacterium]|nr:UPF0164 family protein [Candidatus Bipolaricaulota bacterium]
MFIPTTEVASSVSARVLKHALRPSSVGLHLLSRLLQQSALCLLCLTLIPVSSSAAPIIFEMGASARAMALGGAFSAIADDESAVFYNPAGLAFLDKTTVAAFYQRAFDVVHHVALAGAIRNWGAQFIQIDTGPLESTNEFGNPSGEPAHYATQAGLIGAAFGIENFALGLRGRLSRDGIETDWGIDLGALAQLGSVRLGTVAENLLGSKPIALRLGTAFVLRFSPRFTFTVSLEAWNLVNRPEFHIGLEASINGVQIRAGYDGVAVITGAGTRWNSVRLDWAYRMHPQLPASTMVTVAYLF